MVISAGVFVSCEDYDDDISNLQTQINDLGSTLTALQSQVQAGKWITSVSSTTEGLTIVFSDGTQYTITNGKDGAPGTPGGSGNGTLVEVKDGYWYLNGEKTDYLALTKEDKVPVPYVNEEDGYWYFYNEEGEAVKSDYKALGATYAVKDANTGVWTLHVPDADGTMQSIDLPTAAAKITGLTFVNGNRTFYVYQATWNGFTPNNTDLTASIWAGPKKPLPSKDDAIFGAEDPILVQVSPGDVAKDIENYTLTNSKNVTLGLALTAEPYNGLVTPGGIKTKAATNGNGLYDIAIAPQVVSAANIDDITNVLNATSPTDHRLIGYALVADNVFRSAYNISLIAGVVPTLDHLNINNGLVPTTNTDVKIKDNNNGKGYTIDNQVKVGTTYTVTFSDPAAVYDSYFTFKDRDISTYGITWDNESKTFSISKNPDVGSLTGQFTMTVYTVDITGNAVKTELTFDLSAEMSNNMLAAQTVDVSKTNPGFQYNLSDVAVTGTDAWKQNVNLNSVEYRLYEDKDCTPAKEVPTSVARTLFGSGSLFAPTVAKANGTATTDSDEAVSVKFKITNAQAAASGLILNTTYYLKTTFYTNESPSQVLNTVILPVTFTAPALKDRFATKEGYVVDGVINAYFYKTTETDDNDGDDSKDVDLIEFFKKSVSGATVTLDANTNIVAKSGTNYKSNQLAKLSAGTFGVKADPTTRTTATTLKLLNTEDGDAGAVYKPYPNAQYELGYGEALIVNVEKQDYDSWPYKDPADGKYSFKIRLMSPIMEGSIKAVGDVIPLRASDVINGAKIIDAMIKGYDYNNNEYNLVPDKTAVDASGNPVADWQRKDVAEVEVTPNSTDQYITGITTNPATTNDSGATVNGNFAVYARSLSTTTESTVTVNVTDIWGYTKKSDVKVRITVGE